MGCETEVRIGGHEVSELSPFEQAMHFPELAMHGIDAVGDVPASDAVCIFGVDASSVAGDVLSDMSDELSDAPVSMVCDGRVPGWVGPGTLGVIISYTGSCGQMLDVYEELRRRGSGVICLTSGGELASACGRDGTAVVPIPSGMTPQSATGFVLGAVASIVERAGVFDAAGFLSCDLRALEGFGDECIGRAEPLAGLLRDRVVAVYSTSDIHACSRRWKMSLAGHASCLAFSGELPEFDHNELVGWSDPNEHAPGLAMVVLRGTGRPGLVPVIVECMLEVLDENGRDVVEVDVGTGSRALRNIRGIMLGDSLSYLMGGAQR